MKKKCNFCGHEEYLTNKVQYIYNRSDRFMIVNNVPCEQCTNCGERYYAVDVLKAIENDFDSIYSSKKEIKKEILIPVEEYAEIV
ncbi:MAG: type II toxin-antitoxin system MqsA family antitoxin [Ignavibacteriae bacterium]|nr:type II toxin-antitoxin system MqsA family antitoxin [Ignavibacteriota bacterium]